jgi:hypothetical protein
MTVKSMTTFLNDPSGDPMWEEDPAAKDVVHYDDKCVSSLCLLLGFSFDPSAHNSPICSPLSTGPSAPCSQRSKRHS